MTARTRLGMIALVAALAILSSAAVLFGGDHSAVAPSPSTASEPSSNPADSDATGGSGVERSFGSPRRASFL